MGRRPGRSHVSGEVPPRAFRGKRRVALSPNTVRQTVQPEPKVFHSWVINSHKLGAPTMRVFSPSLTDHRCRLLGLRSQAIRHQLSVCTKLHWGRDRRRRSRGHGAAFQRRGTSHW